MPSHTCTPHHTCVYTTTTVHTIRGTGIQHQTVVYTGRHTATHVHLVTQHAQTQAGTQVTSTVELPRTPYWGCHRPTRDTGSPGETDTGRSHTDAYGLFCSKCPGEPRPRLPGVTHCPLLSSPGRGCHPGRAGCQQGQHVGQVSAGSESQSSFPNRFLGRPGWG